MIEDVSELTREYLWQVWKSPSWQGWTVNHIAFAFDLPVPDVINILNLKAAEHENLPPPKEDGQNAL